MPQHKTSLLLKMFLWTFLQDCRQPFYGGSFFDHEGMPYCETHYHAKRGSLCAGCSKPITGRCITAMFRKFHPEHFVCAFCLKQLNKGKTWSRRRSMNDQLNLCSLQAHSKSRTTSPTVMGASISSSDKRRTIRICWQLSACSLRVL